MVGTTVACSRDSKVLMEFIIASLLVVGSSLLMVFLLTKRVPWRISLLLPTTVVAVLSVLLLRLLDASIPTTIAISGVVTFFYYLGMLASWVLIGDQLRRLLGARW